MLNRIFDHPVAECVSQSPRIAATVATSAFKPPSL